MNISIAAFRNTFTLSSQKLLKNSIFCFSSSSPKVTMYGTTFCAPCFKAKKFFHKNDILYDFINVEEEPMSTKISELKKEYNWPTIPMIFIEGKFIGGYSDFLHKVEEGEININELK